MLTGCTLTVIGLSFTLATRWIFPQILTDPTGSATLDNLARNVGVFVLAVGLINVLGRKVTDPAAVTALLSGSALSIVASGALDLHAVITGLYAPIGWGIVGFKVVLTAGYLYFLRARAPALAIAGPRTT